MTEYVVEQVGEKTSRGKSRFAITKVSSNVLILQQNNAINDKSPGIIYRNVFRIFTS
jgi:hypothetical protein